VSRVLLEAAHAGRSAARRVLLLPPAYARAEDFLREGFGVAVRERNLDLDLLLIEPQFESVTDRSVLEELARQLAAARAAPGTRVWLGGISLGAYLALACAARHERELDGLVLFAPYLGSHLMTGEIAGAGGLAAWDAEAAGAEDEERRIWRFLKSRVRGPLPIHLGLGSEDRFGERHRLLAAALEPRDVDVVPGGHEWPVWRTLWERFLDVRIQPR